MLNYISIKPNKIMYIEFAWKTLQLDKWSTIEGLDMHASLSASCIVNSKMNFIFINTIKSMGDSVTASNSYNSQIVTQVGSQIRVKKRVPCYLVGICYFSCLFAVSILIGVRWYLTVVWSTFLLIIHLFIDHLGLAF